MVKSILCARVLRLPSYQQSPLRKGQAELPPKVFELKRTVPRFGMGDQKLGSPAGCGFCFWKIVSSVLSDEAVNLRRRNPQFLKIPGSPNDAENLPA